MSNDETDPPEHLRIRILHADDSVIVIAKPCNLRSVPGNRSPPGATGASPQRLTSQQAWEAGLQSFKSIQKQKNTEISHQQAQCLSILANTRGSVPRKYLPFQRYMHKNWKRFTSSADQDAAKMNLDELINQVHNILKERQVSLMNLPEQTLPSESALGQLTLLGFGRVGDQSSDMQAHSQQKQEKQSLYVVHRLDCETSGVMVFARTRASASSLCEMWRQGNQVFKTYLASVEDWPPYRMHNQSQGLIKVPLSPVSKDKSNSSSPKWQVDPQQGKPCETKWHVHHCRTTRNKECSSGLIKTPLVLALTPVTGRTHQLRLHCAHVNGCGIQGDSLYGSHSTDTTVTRWNPLDPSTPTLKLHAQILSFPHPTTGERCTFRLDPDWLPATTSKNNSEAPDGRCLE